MITYESIADFAKWVTNAEISPAQIVALKVWNAEKLTWQERALWRKMSEVPLFSRYVPRRYDEGVWILGRQSGKSSRLALVSILWTIYCEAHDDVSPGERLSLLCFSPVLRQNTFKLVAAKIASIPELQELVEVDAPAAGEIKFKNGLDLLEISANPQFARGKTAILAVIDEAAFLHNDLDFQNNLSDLLEAIRPSLIVKRGRLLLLSSPSGMEGSLYRAWLERNENPDVMVLRAPSALLNPSIDAKLLAKERARGDSYFRREFLAEFTEVSGNPFLNPEFIDRAAKGSPEEFEPDKTDQNVFAGLDLADRKDWCSQCISTVRLVDNVPKVFVLSCKIWKPDANGHQILTVLNQMGQQAQRYGCQKAHGDQKSMSAAEGVLSPFGIRFERVVSAGAGSEQAYRTFSALLNEDRLVLPNNPELLSQLKKLEERVTDGNRFLVQGRRSSKDDAAVAAIVSVAMAADCLQKRGVQCCTIWSSDPPYTDDKLDEIWNREARRNAVRIPSFGRPRQF